MTDWFQRVPNALGSFGVKIRTFVSLCATLQNAGQRPLLDEGSSPGSPGMTRSARATGRRRLLHLTTPKFLSAGVATALLFTSADQVDLSPTGRTTDLTELVLWIRTDRLDIRCRSFNPMPPRSGSTPRGRHNGDRGHRAAPPRSRVSFGGNGARSAFGGQASAAQLPIQLPNYGGIFGPSDWTGQTRPGA
jgi:hypothetical protein